MKYAQRCCDFFRTTKPSKMINIPIADVYNA